MSLLLAALLSPSAHAATTLVGPADPLQSIIDASAPGDVLHLQPGLYARCLTLPANKQLTLIGLGGPGVVTVSCADAALPTFDVRGTLTLSGITVTHGGGNRAASVTGQLTARGVDFIGAPGTVGLDGAAVWVDDGDLDAWDTTFSGFVSDLSGGALYLNRRSTADLVRVELIGNSAPYGSGGAVFVGSQATLTARESGFTSSSASAGGAIYLSGTADLRSSHLDDNSAPGGGGAVLVAGTLSGDDLDLTGNSDSAVEVWSGSVDLLDVRFTDNQGYRGGGLELTGGGGSCDSCTFSGNTATYGGGLFVAPFLSFTTRDGVFVDNLAAQWGGGVAADVGSNWSSFGDTFTTNTAVLGGGLWSASSTYTVGDTFDTNQASGGGGGAYFYGLNYPYLGSATFTGNLTGGDGGGLASEGYLYASGLVLDGNMADGDGGGAWASGSLSVSESILNANTAKNGGALAVDLGGLSVYGSAVTGNVATGAGGALYASSPDYVDVSRSWIDLNVATGQGGGLFVKGGASPIYSSGNRWCANDASDGGAIALSKAPGFTASLSEELFQENTAVTGGGAVWLDGSANAPAAMIEHSSFVGNDALSWDGLAVDPAWSVTVYSGLFAGHGDGGLATTDGSAKIALGGTLLDGFPSGYSDLGLNFWPYSAKIPGWTQSGQCGEDLTSIASTSDGGQIGGWDGLGLGVGTDWGFSDPWADYDADGYTRAEGDCDDWWSARSPGALEIPSNGLDEDCDGNDGSDGDGDGWLSAYWGGSDCDDTDPSVHPEADDPWGGADLNCDAELESDQDHDGVLDALDCAPLDGMMGAGLPDAPYDGVDADCDGVDDDVDHDGYAALGVGGTDCDDYDATRSPGAAEVWYDGIDQDCDGNDDDQDGDGSPLGVDCDDLDPTRAPGLPEIWYDGIDGDCAGDPDFDADADGQLPVAWGGNDCDDLDPSVYVGAVDAWYDGIDADCGGEDDFDADGDGAASDAWGGLDCDDADPAVAPGVADAWYDGIDADCAGNDDYDADGDGAASDAWGGADCDDADPTVSPGATELPDQLDNDCVPDNEPDSDADGILDFDELAAGTAIDDADTDADGLTDADEWGLDSDDDGVVDAADPDDDGDGLPSADEADGDTDADGLPDRLDPDSDNDGAADGGDPAPADPGGETAQPPPDGPERYGLGCATTGAPAAGWLPLALGLLALTRRSRSR